jgi:hypothetical protein
MEIRLDEKLASTVESIGSKCNISNEDVIVRAIALMKVAVDGASRGEKLCLISAETRKEINF